MSSLEKISADFKLLQELKTTHVYKAIHSLLVEWKDFEDHINVTRDSFDQCVNEFGSRERNLNSTEESVSESIKKLELLWKSIENRLKQAAHDENEFKLIFEKQRKEFNLKQKRLISCQKSIQLREENRNAQQKLIEELHTKFDFEKKELEKIGKLAGKKFWAMKVKEKYIKIRVSKLDRKEQNVLKKMKEIKLKEKKIKERVASIKLKEEEIDSIIVSNEKRCKDLDFQEKKQNKFLKEFELKKKELVFRLQKKEKLLEERSKELDLKEKELEQNLKRFELKEKEIVSIKISSEERCKELKFQEKQLKERYKAFEGIENQFCTFFNSLVKNDPSEDNHSYANIRFYTTMDGKTLQLYLNDHERVHNSMADEVANALSLSMDPAKLVLDAMEGFYPPHLKNGDKEFEGQVVRRSCILLLEQLRRISPHIQPHVTEAALKLAGDWQEKMVDLTENSLEVLGFLQLLASYGLGSAFEQNELLTLFVLVRQHRKTAKLFQHLGFMDKFSDFIQALIQKEGIVEAIRYIYAFLLVEKFPPVPIMETYSSNSKKLAEKVFEDGNNSCEAQISAINKELVALKAVVECITVHGLELEYPPGELNSRIEQLESLKENPKSLVQIDKRKDSSSAPAAALPLPLPPSTHDSQRSQHEYLAQFPPSLNQNRRLEKRCRDAAPALAPETRIQLQHVTQHPRVEPPAEAALTAPHALAAPLPLPLPPSTHNSQRSQQEHLPQFPLSLDQNKRPEKRRRDEAPALAPDPHFQLQHVTKHPQVEPLAEATLTAPRGTAYPVHSMHAPPQLLPGGQYIERGGPHLMESLGSYNFGDLNPAMPYMNQVGWHYRSNAAAADGGNMHVGFPNNIFGVSSNMNLQPPYWRLPPGP